MQLADYNYYNSLHKYPLRLTGIYFIHLAILNPLMIRDITNKLTA